MIAQVITVLIEICFKERRFFNIGKIGKNVMVEIKKRANMAVNPLYSSLFYWREAITTSQTLVS